MTFPAIDPPPPYDPPIYPTIPPVPCECHKDPPVWPPQHAEPDPARDTRRTA